MSSLNELAFKIRMMSWSPARQWTFIIASVLCVLCYVFGPIGVAVLALAWLFNFIALKTIGIYIVLVILFWWLTRGIIILTVVTDKRD